MVVGGHGLRRASKRRSLLRFDRQRTSLALAAFVIFVCFVVK
jgi:hypothetical protein